MTMPLLFVLGGLIMLALGGEVLVRGSVSLAYRLGISSLMIGLTVIAAGTSMPEVLVAMIASGEGSGELAFANIIGSNTANILLILGATAAISPFTVDRGHSIDWIMISISTLPLFIAALVGLLPRWAAILMLGLLIVYQWYRARAERRGENYHASSVETEAEANSPMFSTALASILTLIGLGLLIAGAYLLIDGAVSLARLFNVSEAVIGLSLVAVGTSLPELAACVIAALRGYPAIAFGNIIGSNIFNSLFVAPIAALVAPITISSSLLARYDLPVMIIASLIPILAMQGKLNLTRLVGLIFLAFYAVYITWRWMSSP